MSIIAADVGGTKTRMVYAKLDSPEHILHEARLISGDYKSFSELLDDFLAQLAQKPAALDMLSLALPGVVTGDVATLTNLPWRIDKAELATHYNVSQIQFINDFQASAYGIAAMGDDDIVELNPGLHSNEATRVVLGAGTGLGLAWLQFERGRAQAYSSEGGHIDFAPVNEQQMELLSFLRERYRADSDGHVSYERILSGAGLVNLYAFCSQQPTTQVDAAWVHAQASTGNPEATAAVRLFVQIYGSYVGNIALLYKPEGGIYIAGGIAGKMIDWMRSQDFSQAYLAKGRMQVVAHSIAVRLVTNERIGVIGALTSAVQLQQGKK